MSALNETPLTKKQKLEILQRLLDAAHTDVTRLEKAIKRLNDNPYETGFWDIV